MYKILIFLFTILYFSSSLADVVIEQSSKFWTSKPNKDLQGKNTQNIENIKLSGVNNLCEIKVLNQGIGLVFKNFQNRFFTIYFNDNLIFQKINCEEEVILKAIKHLNN